MHVGPWLRCLGRHLYLSVNLLVVFIILGGVLGRNCSAFLNVWGHFCLLYLDGVASYVFMRCPPEDSILSYMCHDIFIGVTRFLGGLRTLSLASELV